MKKILVLNFDDHRGGGVIWTHSDYLKSIGHECFDLSYIKDLPTTQHYFIDNTKAYNFSTFVYKLKNCLYNRVLNKIFLKKRPGYLFNYHYYNISARKILRKVPFIPDIILIGWYDFFLRPKTISDLHELSGAKIVISMIDQFVLGGGCHYPFECSGYENGCTHCPLVRFPRLASSIWNEKAKFWKNIPLTILGTEGDLDMVRRTSLFTHAKLLKLAGVPEIPFIMSKSEARNLFEISEEDFVLLFGATFLTDPRKGLYELYESILFFLNSNKLEKHITLLILGNHDKQFSALENENVTIKAPGYLNKEEMYKAYYACDVFVSPSLADSGPYMVNYSIACGRPVLAFNIGIAVELVKTGETGYLAKYKDIRDFACGLNYFYNLSEDEYKRIGCKCRAMMDKIKEEKRYESIIYV